MLPFAIPGLSGGMLKLVGIGLIGAFLLYKWYDYTSTIDKLSSDLKEEINSHNLTKAENAIYQSDITNLKKAVEDQNKQMNKLKLAKEKTVKEYNDFKSLPLSKRLSNEEIEVLLNSNHNYKITCEYGLELNKAISNLKYEDL